MNRPERTSGTRPDGPDQQEPPGASRQTRLWGATCLQVLLIGNIVVGAGACVGAWWHIAWARMQVIGMYQDLDLHGVIDREALREGFGDRLADDWWLVPTEYLLGDRLESAVGFVLLAAAGFAGNVLVLALLLFLARRGRSVGGQGRVESGGIQA